MNAKYLIVDNGGNWKTVEALDELLPKTQGVATLALIVKAIDAINRPAFMVTAQQKEVLRVLNLVS